MTSKEAQGALQGYRRGYGYENENEKDKEKDNESEKEPDALVRLVSIFSIPP